MTRHILALLFLWPVLTLSAQDDPEYRMEIGAGGGMTGYLGDFNGSIIHDLQPGAALIGRYNFNPYMGLKLAFTYSKLKGSSDGTDTYYPDYADAPYTFNNPLYDLSLTYEYNFWPYGTGRDYRGAKHFTPYIAGGLGLTVVKAESTATTMNVPIGLGIKYKIGTRVNLGLEWLMHFSLSDNLDGVEDPYTIQSSGLFKNTDCYSTLQLSLTYSFSAKCVTCNKE